MPGSASKVTRVWTEGKPPGYWMALALGLLVFTVLWAFDFYFLSDFGVSRLDAGHSVARLEGTHVKYYPALQYWFANLGLFVIMAWLLLLGLIMVFKRNPALKKNQ